MRVGVIRKAKDQEPQMTPELLECLDLFIEEAFAVEV